MTEEPTDDATIVATFRKPDRFVAEGFGFYGCNNVNPDICSCATWQPALCPGCSVEIEDGDAIVDAKVWDEDQECWDGAYWHEQCWDSREAKERIAVEGERSS